MLDGLDEVVSRTDRSQVRQQVEDLVHDIYPGNQVLVTAREAGYREVVAWSDVRLATAHQVYDRLGFERIGERVIDDIDQSHEYGFRTALG